MTDKIIATQSAHAEAIETLLREGFGPARFTRAAERLREQSQTYTDLSFVFIRDEQVLASIAYTPIRVGEDVGLLLGPLVVSPLLQNQGVGVKLMEHTLALIDGQEELAHFHFVLLVGDLPYYQRVGFVRAGAGVIAAAPVDPARLLVRGKHDIAGIISGAPELA